MTGLGPLARDSCPDVWGGRGSGDEVQSRGQRFDRSRLCDEVPGETLATWAQVSCLVGDLITRREAGMSGCHGVSSQFGALPDLIHGPLYEAGPDLYLL